MVLVHGAFADSSSWNGVIERLQAQGYPVVAAANPLRGLASDSAYVRSVLDSVKGPIVLAGHSYGGAVISSAAAADPDVKALVYIAAVTPEVGRTPPSWSTSFRATPLAGTWSRRRSRCQAVARALTCMSRMTRSVSTSPVTCRPRSPR
ncbi:alpha/beta hydrolase [Catellatospora sp. NPDC049133]|uniref:alpha/beta fold hydrolase n=1 Tax=Catellatospora sp. NPDC049133 TaxID=3155499 RepID=UPI00340439F5